MLPSYICSQVGLPACKICDLDTSKFVSSTGTLLGIKIQAPYTLALSLITIFCCFRMVNHINSLYSSIGQGEMKTFLYLYIASTFLSIFTINFESYLKKELFLLFSVLETTFLSTAYFALAFCSFTIDKIYGILGLESYTFHFIISAIYSLIAITFIYAGALIRNGLLLITTHTLLNTLYFLLFFVGQNRKLKKMKSDIWSYGILLICLLFSLLSCLHLFLFADLIAINSERNLDSLFFVKTYYLCTAIMVHKFWLSTYDYEIETFNQE